MTVRRAMQFVALFMAYELATGLAVAASIEIDAFLEGLLGGGAGDRTILTNFDASGNIVWDSDLELLQLDRLAADRGGQVFKAQKYPLEYTGLSRLTNVCRTLSESYRVWTESVFSTTNVPGTGMLEDWDDDGVVSLEEFALRTDPLNLYKGKRRNSLKAVSRTGAEFVVDYSRVDSFCDQPFSYEHSTDLLSGPWQPSISASNYSEQISANLDGTETVLVTFSNVVSDSLFIRLRISAD